MQCKVGLYRKTYNAMQGRAVSENVNAMQGRAVSENVNAMQGRAV